MRPDNPTLGARAIALDLDGTLVDSAPDLAAAANATLAELDLGPLAEQRVRRMIGDGIDTLIERCLGAAGADIGDPALLARARGRMRQHYAAAVFERSRLYPGVREALAHWRARGVILACVTNKASALAAPLLERAGLAALLDHLYCADEREQRKPSPVLLQRFLDETRVAADACVMIGDSVHDMGAARAAGVAAVAVAYGYGDPFAEPAAAPACTVARLDALCRAGDARPETPE
jgi:phosphoglycolate phosphatase